MKKMKSILTLAIGLASISAFAQKAENDDMYFTSKDRVKLATTSANTKVEVKRAPTTTTQTKPTPAQADVAVNPTDSYSARTVNPEYSAANTGTNATQQSGDYFIENYRPTGVNGNLNGDYKNSNSTPYYNPNTNPYYASGYSPYSSYGYNGYNPYNMGMGGYGYPYGSGMYMSMGTSFGYSPYSSFTMGYGNPWSMYDPFYSSSMWGPSYGYGYGSSYGMYNPYSFYNYNGYGGYGYPTVVAVDNNTHNGRDVTYQRRADRSSSTGYQPDGNTRSTTQLATRNGRPIASGRTRGSEDSQSYYEKGWRSNTNGAGSTTRTAWSGMNNGSYSNSGSDSHNSGRTNSSWSGWDSGSSINNSNSGARSSWTPSNSGGGGGGATRSSVGGGSTGGGGGGHSRGRD
jgi:hypothetical protein